MPLNLQNFPPAAALMPLQITKNQRMPLNPGTTPPPREGYVVAARATSEPQNLSGITPMPPTPPVGQK